MVAVIIIRVLVDASGGPAYSDLFLLLGMQHMRVVAPYAPKIPISALNEDLERGWFDVFDEEDGSEREDESGVEESCAKIHALLDSEVERIDSRRIVVGGFGHGGAMALFAA